MEVEFYENIQIVFFFNFNFYWFAESYLKKVIQWFTKTISLQCNVLSEPSGKRIEPCAFLRLLLLRPQPCYECV